jgi:RHS repeat-associated protein
VHDDNANVISQDVGATSTTYSYDRNRLLTATTGGATASYRYDPFGRQTSVVSAGLTISRTTYDGFDHIAESEKMNDAGVLESTKYAYDPLDRTASKTAGGETTDYTYLGLSSEVLGEEVAGQLTKSYQYSPWGQRLSQITHQADPEAGVEAGESAYYGYNSHTDVETLTDDTGNTVATYGYTAYGNADGSEYTGIDKPEAGAPEDAEPYNAYRYNSKRWDASSGTYDMGFRDYAPGLNRFTTRDMYSGALANMTLGTDPYTSNRYAFTAGNPINLIEVGGHEPRPWHAEGMGISDFDTETIDEYGGGMTGWGGGVENSSPASGIDEPELRVFFGGLGDVPDEGLPSGTHVDQLLLQSLLQDPLAEDWVYGLEPILIPEDKCTDELIFNGYVCDGPRMHINNIAVQVSVSYCQAVCFEYAAGIDSEYGPYVYAGSGVGAEFGGGASLDAVTNLTPGMSAGTGGSLRTPTGGFIADANVPMDGNGVPTGGPISNSVGFGVGVSTGVHFQGGNTLLLWD